MFKHWLTKLKMLLNRHERANDDNEQQKYRKHPHNIQAKMKYQYPEKQSFRFPVIPDEPESTQPTKSTNERQESPAYERRKKAVTKQEYTPQDEPRQNRKIYKSENAPPFELTQVPSPVYGFQKKREAKDMEQIPAYQRKKPEPIDDQINQPRNALRTVEQEQLTVEKEVDESIGVEPKDNIGKMAKIPKEENSVQDFEVETEKQPSIQTIQQLAKEEAQETFPQTRRISNRRKRREEARKNREKANTVTENIMKPEAVSEVKTLEQSTVYENHKTVDKAFEQDQDESVPVPLPMHLLNDPIPVSNENDIWIEEQQTLLEDTLKHFSVAAKVVRATQGPSVTRFEVQPEMGVKVSKIRNLSDDLKLNMSAADIRIEAPIPGKNTVGIEVPNPNAQMVGLQEMFETDSFKESSSPLTIALGLDIEGNAKVTNIQKMPHGLIAGATGSGKSVCINSILISILYKASHEDVKFLLIDPKMVELAPYNGIPHLVSPVITDVKAATQSLKWAVNEMEERYERFVAESVRDIHRYNEKVTSLGRKDEKMPYIVIVIDELADLMMMSPQDVETSISRIAQKARACGIHLLLATQRPSVDVITGLIKANIPTRIAFSVSSQVDSRTILDTSGAEKLLGKGDMLFVENGAGKSVRLQGPFVSDEEIERVTAQARQIAEPNYLFEQEQLLEQIEMEEDADELLEDAIEFVQQQQSASTSMLQRHFKIGYNRAARLIDTMEANGIISGQNGSKPREVLITETINI